MRATARPDRLAIRGTRRLSISLHPSIHRGFK